jgi:hypothetical protein
MSMKSLTITAMNGLVDGAYGVGGKVAAKAISGMLGMSEGPMGYLVQAIVGVAGSAVVSGFSKEGARAFVQGAFMGPIEKLVAGANIPFVSKQLGDYNNFVLPAAYNAGMLQSGLPMAGYPPVNPAFAGYPPSPGFGDFDGQAETYGR